MPRADQAHDHNAPGPWYVDTRCIRCDVARHWAPGLIEMDEAGRSFVDRQPVGEEQEAELWRAAGACPTKSIGNRQHPREPEGVFPYRMTDGVLALGNNALSSFGGHSYLALRPEGNLMIDSPRFSRPLAAGIDRLGGVAHVLLSHRDDVADADRWAERYGARVWIGEDDSDAAPYAIDLLSGSSVTRISPGVNAIPSPGHTEGHVLYHLDDRCLFTGDTLLWNHRRGEFDVTPVQTFYSWAALADVMDRIATLSVEWVFPGHGMWRHTDSEEWKGQMSALGPAMRRVGRNAWAQRPDTPFEWY
ncbi:MAG: ferredoxin [Chloroflexota bacterium]|nr:ferredoxin [Chloroflexota bacterium]MDE2941149.1 ferredoxin [Chloroflexota bacterium]MDE3267325.1 ferredoxin [Chloroflexota bacterium]